MMFPQFYLSGNYYTWPQADASASFDITPTSGVLYLIPFIVVKYQRFDRLSFGVDTIESGKVATVCVYKGGPNDLPYALVNQPDKSISIGVGGIKHTTVNYAFASGIYWLGIATDSSSAKISAVGVGFNAFGAVTTPTNTPTTYISYDVAWTSGDNVPKTLAGQTLVQQTGVFPVISLRAA